MPSAKSQIEVSSNEYVSHLLAFPNSVVCATTDSSIYTTTLPLTNLQAVFRSPNQTPLAGMQKLPTMAQCFTTLDIKGQLKIWDLRTRKPASILATNLNCTALGTSNFGELALGTEASPDAQIQVLDVRQLSLSNPLAVYKDSHNDDITDLQFHPLMRNQLVSGSTDGVVNLFDISIKDEDEAVLEAYNHQASIHRTGFFTDAHDALKNLRIDSQTSTDDNNAVFALSHMETLSVYPYGDHLPIDYGDLREKWDCQYVADFKDMHFLVGSNDDGWAKLLPMLEGKPQNPILLEGGHANEVIRCFDFGLATCYTGGEDGQLRLWDLATSEHNDDVEVATEEPKKLKSGKSSKKSKRSKPY